MRICATQSRSGVGHAVLEIFVGGRSIYCRTVAGGSWAGIVADTFVATEKPGSSVSCTGGADPVAQKVKGMQRAGQKIETAGSAGTGMTFVQNAQEWAKKVGKTDPI